MARTSRKAHAGNTIKHVGIQQKKKIGIEKPIQRSGLQFSTPESSSLRPRFMIAEPGDDGTNNLLVITQKTFGMEKPIQMRTFQFSDHNMIAEPG